MLRSQCFRERFLRSSVCFTEMEDGLQGAFVPPGLVNMYGDLHVMVKARPFFLSMV
jgi:hypothetical protein